MIGPEALTFDEAEAYCINRHGHLATIKNENDRDEVKSLCQTYYNDDNNIRGCWIGLYYNDTELSWNWKDESDLEYGFDLNGDATTGIIPWGFGEPNSNNEDCIHLYVYKDFNWNDAFCGNQNYPICNKGMMHLIYSMYSE